MILHDRFAIFYLLSSKTNAFNFPIDQLFCRQDLSTRKSNRKQAKSANPGAPQKKVHGVPSVRSAIAEAAAHVAVSVLSRDCARVGHSHRTIRVDSV